MMDDKLEGGGVRADERPRRDQVAPPADTSHGTRSPDFNVSLEDGADIVRDGIIQPKRPQP